MKIKQRPEDFSVKESYRFDQVEDGRYRVYLLDKQKLSTFDAVDRIRERHGLKPGAISYCGLKDKQGRTEQLIAVDGADVDVQEPDLRLKLVGRTDKPLTAANTTSNRFSVTVRSLDEEDLGKLNLTAAEVARLGVINYFDSQRFGSLKHGQGFIAKDLIRGDFEAALKNYMARPSPLDRSDDAKVKDFWRKNWGRWEARSPFKEANRRYERILYALRKAPDDFVSAFLGIDSAHRAMVLFTYQSYLWNETARRLLQLLLPREALFPLPYQAGTLLFHRDAPPELMRELRELHIPLLAPDSEVTHPKVKEAVEWVLGREKLKLSDLRIEEASRLLFFKHEERPLLIYPQKLVLGRAGRDEINRGAHKLNVAFTLPPGSYATLVIKRLFHFSYRDDAPAEILATPRGPMPRAEDLGEGGQAPPSASAGRRPRERAPRGSSAPVAPRLVEAPAKEGFRARQKARKDARAQRREEAKHRK